jgi:hypothetical protein
MKMSLHKLVSNDGHLVHYGLDLPTGGFFWIEFFTQAEMMESQCYEEVKSQNEHLTLTNFQKELWEKFGFTVNIKQCFDDINQANPPTEFQHLINSRLGYNLQEMLDIFSSDLVSNWM